MREQNDLRTKLLTLMFVSSGVNLERDFAAATEQYRRIYQSVTKQAAVCLNHQCERTLKINGNVTWYPPCGTDSNRCPDIFSLGYLRKVARMRRADRTRNNVCSSKDTTINIARCCDGECLDRKRAFTCERGQHGCGLRFPVVPPSGTFKTDLRKWISSLGLDDGAELHASLECFPKHAAVCLSDPSGLPDCSLASLVYRWSIPTSNCYPTPALPSIKGDCTKGRQRRGFKNRDSGQLCEPPPLESVPHYGEKRPAESPIAIRVVQRWRGVCREMARIR